MTKRKGWYEVRLNRCTISSFHQIIPAIRGNIDCNFWSSNTAFSIVMSSISSKDTAIAWDNTGYVWDVYVQKVRDQRPALSLDIKHGDIDYHVVYTIEGIFS